MNDTERMSETQRWLRFAAEDMLAAQALLTDRHLPPRLACWLSQQAAEKALKAALIFHQIDFPRTHDLDLLRNLLPEQVTAKSTFPDLAALTEWGVEARYPGDWPDATPADGEEAVRQADAICRCIQNDLARCGLKLQRDD